MKNIFATALRGIRGFLVWVSPPTRLFAFLLGLALLLAVASWGIFEKETGYIVYFPGPGGTTLHGEERRMPRRMGAEANARELVMEFLLGPASPNLSPAFPIGTPLEGIMFRKGTLYIDLGEDAALLAEPQLRLAISALDRTIRLGIHQARRVVVTIGGIQPWTQGLVAAAATSKKP